MEQKKHNWINWIPPLLWMGLIFLGSTDLLSAPRTSGFLVKWLKTLHPEITKDQIQMIQYIARKAAHVMEYALLTFLLWRAKRVTTRPKGAPWSWSDAVFAWGAAVFFALTDEFHQSTVPSRVASFGDVLFDASGATLALLIIWLIGFWRKK